MVSFNSKFYLYKKCASYLKTYIDTKIFLYFVFFIKNAMVSTTLSEILFPIYLRLKI